MKYLAFEEGRQSYKIALLVPQIRRDEIESAYLNNRTIDKNEILVLDLHQTPNKKKTPAKEIKEYLTEEIQPILDDFNVEYVVVADAEYFKILAKINKADGNLGYILPSHFGSQKVLYIPNFKAIFYDPEKVRAKIDQAISALESDIQGNYIPPGDSIIKFEAYPKTYIEIKHWLEKLIEMDVDLTADIEGFSLKHTTCGIGTISFAWNKHEGIAFPVDYTTTSEESFNIRMCLREFFRKFQKKMIWHNISFDIYILIYQLFMRDILDVKGLLKGKSILLKNWDDTKLITYLATNSCAGNKLGLKDQAQEYAGNYAVEEIEDITKIPLDNLLRYNLVDSLSTWYVFEKNYPKMIADDQLGIYEELFKPAVHKIIQMQLTGLPLDMERVLEVKKQLEDDENNALEKIHSCKAVQGFVYQLNEKFVEKKNATYKKKRITIEDANEEFNPGSSTQLQDLLYGYLGLPIIGYTDSNQPSTSADTIKALKTRTKDPEELILLDAILDLKAVSIILNTFIKAFLAAPEGPDGWHYLFGNFNLGGTVSGRLSSSKPNLQNLPATGSKYSKIIKSCFAAPPGWIMVGLDFDSLEDRISALTTKDPNKLKVYTDGYDGHCLRAFAYFGDQMTGIDPNSVESINSIAKLYKPLRQDSKVPTFALTYAGTWITLVNNAGFSEETAKMIEKRYHELYIVSDQWVAAKLAEASKTGYVTAAFGLKVRTPLLNQVIRGTKKTPYEAEAEGRTAGNALGQSWCLLNTRAGNEFMEKVWSSEYAEDIKPCADIHDAQYYLIRDDLSTLMFVNKYLVKAVKWQEHPDIKHDAVKLGGKLSIFYPTWAKEFDIDNNASEQQILDLVQEMTQN